MSRKSDVALPTIMNVFLMIAVILVASSFLLKAFGIDIWGFLGNLFAGLSTSKPGKALHVKIDPGNNEVWEFHLTGEKKHCQEFYSSVGCGEFQSSFYIADSSWKQKKCIIFTTIKKDDDCRTLTPPLPSVGELIWDAGNIYYVDPGSIIENSGECGKNLGSCLINKQSGCVVKEGLKSSPGEYTIISDSSVLAKIQPLFTGKPCAIDPLIGPDERDKILNYEYNSNANFKDDPSRGCSIVKSLLEKDQYTVKEGLICDKDGIWQPCTEQRAKKSYGVPIGEFEYKCQESGTWSRPPEIAKPTLTLSTDKEVYLPSDTGIQLKATTDKKPKAGEVFYVEVTVSSTKRTCRIFQDSNSCEILYNLPTVSGPIEFKAALYNKASYDTVSGQWTYKSDDKLAEASEEIKVDLWTEKVDVDLWTIEGWKGEFGSIVVPDTERQIGIYSARGNSATKQVYITYEFQNYLSVSSSQKIIFNVKANSDSTGRVYITDANKITKRTIDDAYKIGKDWSIIELGPSGRWIGGAGFEWKSVKSITFYGTGNNLETMWIDYLRIEPPPEPTVQLIKDSPLPAMLAPA